MRTTLNIDNQLLDEAQRITGLSEKAALVDKQVVARARRIERFLSQPFFVAEAFTGKSGNFTSLKDTIRSFKGICDGQYDHLPESAFMYVGTIEEAEEAAKKMAGK